MVGIADGIADGAYPPKPHMATMSPIAGALGGHALEAVEGVQAAQAQRRGLTMPVSCMRQRMAIMPVCDACRARCGRCRCGPRIRCSRWWRSAAAQRPSGSPSGAGMCSRMVVKQRPQVGARACPDPAWRCRRGRRRRRWDCRAWSRRRVQLDAAAPAPRPPPRRSARRAGRSC